MTGTREWKSILENSISQVVVELKDAVKTPAAIILSGPVGAGKTTLAKLFAENEMVMSPTYSIINEFSHHAHADLYRIENASDLVHLELPLYLEDKDYFLIEWGSSYISELKRLIDIDFHFYELTIEPVVLKSGASARNYALKEVD